MVEQVPGDWKSVFVVNVCVIPYVLILGRDFEVTFLRRLVVNDCLHDLSHDNRVYSSYLTFVYCT